MVAEVVVVEEEEVVVVVVVVEEVQVQVVQAVQAVEGETGEVWVRGRGRESGRRRIKGSHRGAPLPKGERP